MLFHASLLQLHAVLTLGSLFCNGFLVKFMPNSSNAFPYIALRRYFCTETRFQQNTEESVTLSLQITFKGTHFEYQSE